MKYSDLEIQFISAQQYERVGRIDYGEYRPILLNIENVEPAAQPIILFLMNKVQEALNLKGAKIVFESGYGSY